jgi:hypothetical protein
VRHGDEQAQVLEWAYGVLSADAALAAALGVAVGDLPGRVWPDVAPQDTPTPWVVYSAQEALDVLAVGPGARLVTTVPLNVRVVWRTDDPGQTGPAVRRIYALLHGNHNTPVSNGGLILTARRTTVLDYPDDTSGLRYRHTGGLYEVQVN